MAPIEVALEIGKKRTFASAVDWPGWTRSGRDEERAVEALIAYAPRYQRVVGRRRIRFEAPDSLKVVERMQGNATTDFGAPDMPSKADSRPVDDLDLKRFLTILDASWDALARAVEAAEGKELKKGPRGGGRSAAQITDHVTGTHQRYLRQIYWRERHPDAARLSEAIEHLKQADAKALAFAISDEMPDSGPRGGELSKPRYFVRRAAWHILDHAWEIEDRIEA
jgi:hypothetical protein